MLYFGGILKSNVHHLCLIEIYLFVSKICDISFVDWDPFLLKENLRRNPLRMDIPEKILSQAHNFLSISTVKYHIHCVWFTTQFLLFSLMHFLRKFFNTCY
jgi:hypothetical protein